MEASMYKANGIFAKELEDELMKFTMKPEDSGVQKGHSVRRAKEAKKNIDVEINVTKCTKSMVNEAAQDLGVQKRHSVNLAEELQKNIDVEVNITECTKSIVNEAAQDSGVQKGHPVNPDEEVQKNIDVDVNITECTKSMGNKAAQDSGVQKGHSVNPAEEVQKNIDVEIKITECTKSMGNKAAQDSGVQKGHLVNPDEEVQKNIDVEVNITECTKSMGNKAAQDSGVQKRHSVNPDEEVQNNIDVEVNITECTKSIGYTAAAPPEYQDLTESEGSSSFDESESGLDNDDTMGNFEALSDLCGDSDGFGDNFRRKKLTAHWRSFIQPIMWRCKWTELQIKKLQFLARQYDRELEEHNKRKHIHLVDSTLIDGVKSLPFSRTNDGSGIVRRKKRRRAEETTDVAAYMSSHNLFSYYENKKNPTEGAAMSNLPKVNTDDEFWANDDLSSFVSGDGDNCLEDILRKIEFLQSQAGQLRSRVERVISENAEEIFFADNLNLPSLPFNNLPANNGGGSDVGTYNASQLNKEFNMADDKLVLESAVTNHGDGGISSLNANVDRARFAGAYKNVQVEDRALINNRKVKEEMNNFEEVIINPIQKSSVHIKEPSLSSADQPPSKVRSIAKTTAPRSKRKRGRKKGTRRRTRRSTG